MTDIVRRPEYRRKRKYKARARKRYPIERFFRTVFGRMPPLIFPLRTPFLDRLKHGPVGADNYASHLAGDVGHVNGIEAVPVHSVGSGRAPQLTRWGGVADCGTIVYWDIVTRKPA